MTHRELTTCRLCDGTLTEIIRLADTPIANALASSPDEVSAKYPLYLSQCRGCLSVQMPVAIDARLLFPDDYPYVSGTSPVFVRHLAEQASAVSAQCGLQRGDLVVEIGSNDGTLLRLLRERGFRAIGVDPATNLARAATEGGLPTFAAPFSAGVGKSLADNIGQAKLVISNNALAHVEDLIGIFHGVRELLEPGGTLVFEVGYLLDVIAGNNFPVVYHEHTFCHSLWPLHWALARCDLFMYHAHRIPTQGGSVRVYATNATPKPKTPQLEALMKEERDLPQALRPWPMRIDAATAALYGMLRSLKAQGKTIAGYGAAAKATTLLHQCGIGRDLVDFVCDANPRKVGRYLPGGGNNIPIVAPSELDERQPDYCVILSGNFADSIREQHPAYLGRWVAPLPMPVVIGEAVAA